MLTFDGSTRINIIIKYEMIPLKAKLALLVVTITLAAGLTNNAFAHKSQVVGDYNLEVGWRDEPVIVGVPNAITVAITPATEGDKANAETMNDTMSEDMSHDQMSDMTGDHASESDHAANEEEGPLENGVGGLASTLEVTVTLNDEKTTLEISEDPNNPGMYIGEYTPSTAGYPTVHVFTTISDVPIEATFHPEEVSDGASFEQTSSDGTVNVNILTTAPTKGEGMLVKMTFTDADGNPLEHVNYSVTATQNGESVLDIADGHAMEGNDQQSTSELTSNDPVDVQVKILGIGQPDDKAGWSGPAEDLSTIHVTPEFGPVVTAMFGIGIIATIGLRSKLKF